ncbi:type II secretion system protein [Candidatus Daviesbacteria bacterium]|nr:type II secretion system protein [Candidatus Daviesbacteria bacterium]
MSKNGGFTLIELLVAISIIAILSVIGFISYQTVLRQGRDAKRQSDLKTIQSALEQYHNDQSNYSLFNGGTCSAGKVAFNTTSPCNLTDPVGAKTYMNRVPVDPLSSNSQYLYVPYNSSSGVGCDNDITICNGYCLYANLENPTGISNPTNCASPLPAGYNLAVTAP